MSRGSFQCEIPVECWIEKGRLVYVDVDGNTVRFPSNLIGDLSQYICGKGDKATELMLHVVVSWYYDPGTYYDPPEGDEERLVQAITCGGEELNKDLAEELVELFEYIIEDYEPDGECYE